MKKKGFNKSSKKNNFKKKSFPSKKPFSKGKSFSKSAPKTPIKAEEMQIGKIPANSKGKRFIFSGFIDRIVIADNANYELG